MAEIEGAGPAVRVRFDEEEAQVLRGLLGEMKELLVRSAQVQDAVLDRLFPSAYADPDDAKAFSELVGDDLRDGKVERMSTVLDAFGAAGAVDLSVAEPEVHVWLTVLTDVRLALGTRFEVTEEKMSQELDPDDPSAPGLAVLHWLGWLQEMFIRAISEEGHGDPSEGG